MEIVWLHLRSRSDGKPIEKYYTLLAVEETDSHIAGVKTEEIPNSIAKTIKESPEIFNSMPSNEAKMWLKEAAFNSYRKGWRKWRKRDTEYGVGAKIIQRFKIGQQGT